MGASNAKAAYAVWGRLPDPAFRLLVFMALTSRDQDDPPSCWAGQDALVVGMGRRPPRTDDEHRANLRALGRAMQRLRNEGAIARVAHSAPGQTARHVLNLTPDAARRVNTGRGTTGEHRTPGGQNTGRPATEHRTPRDRTPDAPRPAEEEQEQVGLRRGAATPSSAQPHGDAQCVCGHTRFTRDGDCARCGAPRAA